MNSKTAAYRQLPPHRSKPEKVSWRMSGSNCATKWIEAEWS